MEDWGTDHWAYYYNEGVNYKEKGDKETSAEYFLKALKMEPELEMPEAWHNAGAALLALGRTDEAQPLLQKAISLYDLVIHSIREAYELESEYETDQLLGKIDEEDEEDEAEDFLNQFGEDDEDDEEPHLEFDDAEVDMLVDEPVGMYLFWRACCYALMGDKSRMLMSLEESIAEDDWHALEALEEEELIAFRDDIAFRSIVDPVVAQINSPEHRHLFDIFERIETKILIGFEDPNEFIEGIVDEVDAENWSDKTPVTWMRKTTRDLHRKRLADSKSWEQPTDLERLATAFDGLIERGIAALHNVSPEDFESVDEVVSELQMLATAPESIDGVCFYEEEDVLELIHRESGPLTIRFRSTLDDTALSHLLIGKKIVEVLQQAGFNPAWDERVGSSIVLPAFSWKKVFVDEDDQERWDPWRLFDKF